MTLLQVKVDDKLKKAIDDKADAYGIPSSSLVRIVLVKSFLDIGEAKLTTKQGSVFNADRDNRGRGIKIDDIIAAL